MSLFQQHPIASPYTSPSQAAIVWPLRYQPGTTDSFISNETIAKEVTASQIWAILSDSKAHQLCSNGFANFTSTTPIQKDSTFSLKTQLDSTPSKCIIKECVPPERLAWCSENPSSDGEDIYHAWLIESLEGGLVRILSQQSIIDETSSSEAERVEKRNKRLIAHQDWLEGLVSTAKMKTSAGDGLFRPQERV
jgi:hypothetical protein